MACWSTVDVGYAASSEPAFKVMFWFQELLPDHLLKEAKVAADKSKGSGVQWPFGWGKKKCEKELEALPTPQAEVLKAWPSQLLGFNATVFRVIADNTDALDCTHNTIMASISSLPCL